MNYNIYGGYFGECVSFHYSHAGHYRDAVHNAPRATLAVPSPGLKPGRELCELQEHHTPSRDALWRSRGAGTASRAQQDGFPCHREEHGQTGRNGLRAVRRVDALPSLERPIRTLAHRIRKRCDITSRAQVQNVRFVSLRRCKKEPSAEPMTLFL